MLFDLYNGLQYTFFESPVTPELVVSAVKKTKPIILDTVPWLLGEIATICASDPVLLTQLKELRLLASAGAAVVPQVAEFYELHNIPLVTYYGQTEIGAAMHASISPTAIQRWKFMQPMPATQVIITQVAGEEDGELVITNTPSLALGYFTDGKLVPFKGEYHTNDIFRKTESGDFCIELRKDAILVHLNGEKTNPVRFWSIKYSCPVIQYICVIGHTRPHNILIVQIKEDHISLRTEQEVWEAVEAANSDFEPHSRVRRDHIIFVPACSTPSLPISSKGEVLVRQAEIVFADQLEKVYTTSSFFGSRYPEGFVEQLRVNSPMQQKATMRSLIADVMAFVLSLDAGQLELQTSFQEQSVRSFEAVQIRNVLSGIVGIGQLPATMLYDYPNINLLADWLLEMIGLGGEAPPVKEVNLQRAKPIAIVGVGCKFGGGIEDMQSFWEVISNGVDTVTKIPPERWDWEKYYDPKGGAGKMTFSEAAFISQFDQFDADLFGMLPKEANELDPQHRMLLEICWKAIENAGYSPYSLRGTKTGVFIGMLHHDYGDAVHRDYGDIDTIDTYFGTGNTFSAASGHISYALDLRGPCMAVDTACSSTLVTLQLACQSLESMESDICLMGGVNLMLVPHGCVWLSRAGMTSVDGRCKAFDTSANGFGRGEGCGIVMLKRLEDAIAHGDNILSVVCGVAVNHDGKSNGFTAPSREAQERVIESALKKAGLQPTDIGFLETHGTGTVIGDNIEMRASGAVLGRNRPRDSPLLIGSVKTNIGHTEAAAGIAGVLKATLCLQHKVVPKLNLFKSLNPNINLEQIPDVIPIKNEGWKTSNGDSRYASINSFGFSGTNAHAILTDAPTKEYTQSDPTHHYILPLSACPKTPTALTDMVRQFRAFLAAAEDSVDNICFTAQTVRSPMRLRTAFVGQSKRELVDAMQRYLSNEDNEISRAITSSTPPKVVIIVPGDACLPDKFAVAQALYSSLHLFKSFVVSALASINQILGVTVNIDAWLESGLPYCDAGTFNLVTFVIEYALLCVWKAWGVSVQIVYSRGIGVYAALCAYEAIDFANAVRAIQAGNSFPLFSSKIEKLQVQIIAFECPTPLAALQFISHENLATFIDTSSIIFTVTASTYELELGSVVSAATNLHKLGYMPLLSVLAKLYIAGVDVVWESFHSSMSHNLCKVALPAYPFQHQRYWYSTYTKQPEEQPNLNFQNLSYMLLKIFCVYPHNYVFIGEVALDKETKFLEDHKIFGNVIFPMAGYIEMALECANKMLHVTNICVKDFVVCEPLILQFGDKHKLLLVATPYQQQTNQFSIEIFSQLAIHHDAKDRPTWTLHATGLVLENTIPSATTLSSVETPSANPINKNSFYTALRMQGFEYGPHFSLIADGFVDEKSSIVTLKQLPGFSSNVIYHPGLLDACLHSMILYFHHNAHSQTHIYLPISCSSITAHGKLTATISSLFEPTKGFSSKSETLTGKITIFDDGGNCVTEILDITVKRTSNTELRDNLNKAKRPSDIFYGLTWRPSELSTATATSISGNVLVYTSGDEFSANVAEQIKQASASAKVLIQQLSLETPLSTVIQDSFCEGGFPAHIVYVATPDSDISLESPLSSQFNLLENALLLTQRILASEFQALPRLWFVTKNATWLSGDTMNLLSSPIWGFGATVCQEHPELGCKRVDLDVIEGSGDLLWQEISKDNNEDQVGFRQGVRHVMRFGNIVPSIDKPYSCDPCAAYIVTGGFGGIGTKTIDMLISLGARKIILISRGGRSNDKQQQILTQWQATGVDIEVHKADLADYPRLQEIFLNLKHPLKGILHVAGITDDASLLTTDWSKFETVFASKVYGSWNLHSLTLHLNLDFFVLFSSISSVFGNPGQSNYSAANYFMDALAHYRRVKGLSGLSINWGVWGDVGLAAERNLVTTLKRKGINAFNADIGVGTLQTLLTGSPSASVAVVAVSWELYLRQYPQAPPLFAEITYKSSQPPSKSATIIPELANSRDPAEALFEYIKQETASLLGMSIDRVHADRALTELGVDSLVATQLRNNFGTALNLSLPTSLIFDYPTINELFEHLRPLVAKKLQANSTANTEKAAAMPVFPKTFGLTASQLGLWWNCQFASSTPTYNINFYFQFTEAEFNVKLMRTCWNELTKIHHILRTILPTDVDTGMPVHEVKDNMQNPFSEYNVTDDAALRKALEQEHQAPFDLQLGPLFRFSIFSNGNTHVVMIVAHHIVADGATILFIFEDLFHLYKSHKDGVALPITPAAHYSDFVLYCKQRLHVEGDNLWQYWKQQLSFGIPHLQFNFAIKQSVNANKPVGATYAFLLGANVKLQLVNTARALGITVYHTLMAVYLAVLSKYTNQTEIVVGSFMSTRSKAEFARLMGFCVETILVRGDFAGDPTASEIFTQVSKTTLAATKHAYPFPILKEKLDRESGSSNSIQTAFNFMQAIGDSIDGKHSFIPEFEPPSAGEQIPQLNSLFDLYLEIEGSQYLYSELRYNPQKFHKAYIEAFANHFRELLSHMCDNLNVPLSKLSILTESEYDVVVNKWNDTDNDFPILQARPYDLVQKQMLAGPSNTAVIFNNESTTYAQLEYMVNQLANVLRGHGIGPNISCCVYMERSLSLVAAMLAVFTVGGVYIPLEPDYPIVRIEYMMEDAKAHALITNSTILEAFLKGTTYSEKWRAWFGDRIVFMDKPILDTTSPDEGNISTPEDIAYIMFTSGSTGTPKGVLVPNRSFTNFAFWQVANTLQPTNKVLMKASICFDVSLIEVFWALTVGATLVVAKQGGHRNADYILDLIQTEKINAAYFAPSHIQALSAYPNFNSCTASIHTLAVAGETSSIALYHKLGKRMLNVYGPTETNGVTYFSCKTFDPTEKVYNTCSTVPIGKPFPNTKIYILDSHMKPVPCGVTGELYISGPMVGLGYLNKLELSQQKFIANPFHPAWKMYKTGDMGTFLLDGNIEIFGRRDNQVKLRGLRIELGEIDFVLLRHANINEAITVLAENQGNKLLVSYITTQTQIPITEQGGFIAELKRFLSAYLPAYMVPMHYMFMAELPHNNNDKIDRHALPNPNFHQVESIQPIPLSATEELLRSLWIQLGLLVTSTTQSFYDVGGSSLLAMQFLNTFQAKFHQKLPIAVFHQDPTIKGIATFLHASVPAPATTLNPPRHSITNTNQCDIAIVGMSCRYPGANSVSQLWQVFMEAKDVIQPAVMIDANGTCFPCCGGFVQDLENFDPKLFKIAPREANLMDPQQRLLLLTTWEALENAVIAPHTLKKTRTGVFIGGPPSSYFGYIQDVGIPEADFSRIPGGNFSCALSGRIAFTFDLTGPTFTIDTACSSSLVAIHQAYKSLITHESDMCIAGGVNTLMMPQLYTYSRKLGIVATRCNTFDTSADGYARSEGCGVVILKRLDDALQNGDPIVAVIKGSAINQDGRTKSLSTPNGEAQFKVIQEALHAAQLSPTDVSFVEAHGTGTPLGDPIEMEAIIKALCPPNRAKPLIVATAKTNIGHAEAAAGVSGVIKAALSLQHNIVPQHLHLKTLNPNLPDLEGRVVIPSKGRISIEGSHIAGVSSFGFAGTNAHVVLASAPTEGRKGDFRNSTQTFIVTISAVTETALRNTAERYKEFLFRKEHDISSVSLSCLLGRSHYEHRLSLVGSADEIAAALDKYLLATPADIEETVRGPHQYFNAKTSTNTKMVFMFSGEEHTLQDKLMNAIRDTSALSALSIALVGDEPVFQDAFSECLAKYDTNSAGSELALFTLQYALAKTWQAWGVEISSCIGHGVGEYAAACFAGVISLEDAIVLLQARQNVTAGLLKSYAELVVYAPGHVVHSMLANAKARIVSSNGIEKVVVCGQHAELQKLESALRARDFASQFFSTARIQSVIPFLETTHLQQFQALTQHVKISSSVVPLHTPHQHSLKNLFPHVIDLVTTTQHYDQDTIVLEINIACVTSAILRHMYRNASSAPTIVSSCRFTDSPVNYLEHVLAKLYSLGVSIDWQSYVNSQRKYANARKVVLPNYAFDKVRCWINDKPFRIVGDDALREIANDNLNTTDNRNANNYSNANKLSSHSRDKVLNYIPLLDRLPAQPIFQAEIYTTSDHHSQILGLNAEALSQYDSDQFSANVQLSHTSFEPLPNPIPAEKCHLSIQISSAADDKAQVRAYIRFEGSKTWTLFATVTGTTSQITSIPADIEIVGEHINTGLTYIKTIRAADNRTNILALVSMHANSSAYAVVQALLLCCRDIAQGAFGKDPRIMNVDSVHLSSLSNSNCEVAVRLNATLQEDQLANNVVLDVLFTIAASQIPFAAASGIVMELCEREVSDIPTQVLVQSKQERQNSAHTLMETEIAALWQHELMQPHVGLDDDFAEIGGDSVFSTVIAAQIKKKYNVEVGPDTFVGAPTVRTLAKHVECLQQMGAVATTDASKLVLLQQGTSRFPIFLVHPIGGTVSIYKHLVQRLGSKYTVYGIQGHGLNAGETPMRDITEMARKYVQYMKSVQPQGPYHVGGASFGGIVAFEMAHQLHLQGDVVDLLALIDSPSNLLHLNDDEILLQCLKYVFGTKINIPNDMSDATTAHKVAYLLESGQLPKSLGAQSILQYAHVWTAHHTAMLSFTPHHYEGTVHFFKASVKHEVYPWVPRDAWNAFADHVVVTEVQGDHTSMLSEHNVHNITSKLCSVLKF